MEQLGQIFGRLEWWQRPFVAVLPVLLAALILPMVYTLLVRIPIDALRGRFPKDDRRQGLNHLVYGGGIFLVACCVTWLSYGVQISWLGGHEHVVTIGAFFVGIYELLYGLGIWLFRTGTLGVVVGIYAFGAYCVYGLLHWTLGWF